MKPESVRDENRRKSPLPKALPLMKMFGKPLYTPVDNIVDISNGRGNDR
jgi:hypothetical protein